MAAVLARDSEGRVVRKSGIMAIVLAGGTVYPTDPIRVTLPDLPFAPLEPV
jgi:MOSC domain-containing protein YiiM